VTWPPSDLIRAWGCSCHVRSPCIHHLFACVDWDPYVPLGAGHRLIYEIPAKKWGDTEIAERGRSVLVMRARYRSAGLTPHQRGWTDAG